MSEIAEEAVEGNGSLASLVSDDRPRFVVMPAISKRKNSSEEIFYTSDIEQIAKMEKLQNEYLDKLGKSVMNYHKLFALRSVGCMQPGSKDQLSFCALINLLNSY